MDKIFESLLQKLRNLNLPKGKFAVFGSGPLGIRKIRDCRDLDVVVSKQVFYDFGHKAGWSLKESANLAYLEKDKIELYKDWGPGEWDIDKLIQEAETINGLPFVRLEEVVKWKQLKGREKDKRDIQLINDYLKSRKKLVYCAHSGETMKYSEYIFKFVHDKGYLPLCPFLVVPYYMGTFLCAKGSKKQCIQDTVAYMLYCDELWIFGENEEDFLQKGGVRGEVEIWKREKNEDTIKFFTWKQVGVPKYVTDSKWHDHD